MNQKTHNTSHKPYLSQKLTTMYPCPSNPETPIKKIHLKSLINKPKEHQSERLKKASLSSKVKYKTHQISITHLLMIQINLLTWAIRSSKL